MSCCYFCYRWHLLVTKVIFARSHIKGIWYIRYTLGARLESYRSLSHFWSDSSYIVEEKVLEFSLLFARTWSPFWAWLGHKFSRRREGFLSNSICSYWQVIITDKQIQSYLWSLIDSFQVLQWTLLGHWHQLFSRASLVVYGSIGV